MLVTVDEVIASMGLSTALKADLTATITSNIQKAQLRLGSDLGCAVEQYSCIDQIHLNSDLYAGVTPHDALRVKLSNLFVVATSVGVTAATSVGGAGVVVTPLMIDAEQGNLYFPLDMDNRYLTVSYESGIDPEEVPVDLKQALLLYVSMIFAETQPDQSGSKPMTNVNDLAMSMAATYKKVPAFSFRPFAHAKTPL
jgi:hypothetical protein